MLAERTEQLANTAPATAAGRLWALVHVMRPVHWLKNGFVAAPLLFSRSFHDPDLVSATLWATVAFCLAASAVYVWNDLWDEAYDRNHTWKRHRPIAAGQLSPAAARGLLIALAVCTAAALFCVPSVWGHVVAYVAINAVYSMGLKRVPWLDIGLLCAGFVLRVDAGAAAIAVTPSLWMTVATLALALYLASLKRYAELASHGSKARESLARYQGKHLRLVAIAGGTGAILCYGLFVAIARPVLVFTLIPVVVGVVRYGWLVFHRSGVDSPILLIARDPILVTMTLLWAADVVMGLW